MTDFQFDPGATNDPEENLHPYTMKPQTHGALDIHVLQISGQPMPAGAAMPVPKGAEPFTYTPKPMLHSDEPQSLPEYPLSMKAKTATGGSVWYDYTYDKKPLAATVYDQSGQFESFHNPSEIAFPAFKTPVKGSSALDQLDAEITKLLGPEKPALHVGELSPAPETSPSIPAFKAKTPSGGSVYYYYDKNWKPDSADVYENATYVKTHKADEINFPLHPSFEQKPFNPNEFEDIHVPGTKPSLAKVNLPENYPREEQIDELYNKPQEPITAYPKFSPKEPLTESEQNLISDYTGSFYHEIANHIYGHYPNPKLEPKIEAINKAIAKHPLTESVTLYRGLSYGNFQKFANLKPGQTATYDGFMSTSSNKHVGSKWKEGYHFVIETPVGTPALPVKHMSQHSGENEVLLSTKTKLKFIRREGNALHFEVVPRTE